MPNMNLIKCTHCHKLLLKATYSHLEVKCPRCKTLNSFSNSYTSASHNESATPLERRRASNPKPTGQGLDHDDDHKQGS